VREKEKGRERGREGESLKVETKSERASVNAEFQANPVPE